MVLLGNFLLALQKQQISRNERKIVLSLPCPRAGICRVTQNVAWGRPRRSRGRLPECGPLGAAGGIHVSHVTPATLGGEKETDCTPLLTTTPTVPPTLFHPRGLLGVAEGHWHTV